LWIGADIWDSNTCTSRCDEMIVAQKNIWKKIKKNANQR
jgi:hypothetical protein